MILPSLLPLPIGWTLWPGSLFDAALGTRWGSVAVIMDCGLYFGGDPRQKSGRSEAVRGDGGECGRGDGLLERAFSVCSVKYLVACGIQLIIYMYTSRCSAACLR